MQDPHLSAPGSAPKQDEEIFDLEQARKLDLLEKRLFWGGLLAVSFLIMQAFISTTPDLAISTSLTALAIAIPLLAGGVVISVFEEKGVIKEQRTLPIDIFSMIGALGALIGIIAAFWHVSRMIGAVCFVSVLIAVVIFGTHYLKQSGVYKSRYWEALAMEDWGAWRQYWIDYGKLYREKPPSAPLS